jgi:hypothetical protein
MPSQFAVFANEYARRTPASGSSSSTNWPGWKSSPAPSRGVGVQLQAQQQRLSRQGQGGGTRDDHSTSRDEPHP